MQPRCRRAVAALSARHRVTRACDQDARDRRPELGLPVHKAWGEGHPTQDAGAWPKFNEKAARKAKKPEFAEGEQLQTDADLAPEGAEELVDIEATEEPVAGEEDETFLEEEEGGDVSGIIGGTVAEGDEEV